MLMYNLGCIDFFGTDLEQYLSNAIQDGTRYQETSRKRRERMGEPC